MSYINRPDIITGDLTIIGGLSNGQNIQFQAESVELAGLVGAVVSTDAFIPGGAIILSVSTRVTTAITGATSFDVGLGSDADRYGGDIPITLGSSSNNINWTVTSIRIFGNDNMINLTAKGGNFTGGAVRVTVYFLLPIGATS